MHVEVDGLRLFVDVLSPEYVPDGRRMRRRRTVVMLHGGMDGDSSNCRTVGELLADDACVVVPDRRGLGRSDGGGDPNAWSLERYADDVYELCKAMGIEKPIVAGLSYGGFIALQYAIRHPDHPAGLILMSSGPGFDRDALMAGWQKLDQGRDAAEDALIAERGARVVKRRELTAYPPRLFQLDLDLRPDLSAITCPLLAVIGDADPVFPASLSDEVAAAVSSADTRVVRMPGADHRLDISAPKETAAELRAFIEHIGPPEDPWADGNTPYDEQPTTPTTNEPTTTANEK